MNILCNYNILFIFKDKLVFLGEFKFISVVYKYMIFVKI